MRTLVRVVEVLANLNQQLKNFAHELDTDVISGTDAARLLTQAKQAKGICAFLESAFARRVEQTNQHQAKGFGSAADFVASQTGMSGAEARNALATARQLEQLPKTKEAFSNGQLSASQAAEIARGATADPSAETDLLDIAKNDSAEALKRARTRLEQLPPLEKRRRSRRFSYQAGSIGMINFWGTLPNEDFAFVGAALQAGAKRFFRQASKEGRRELQSAYLADALVDLARSPNEKADSAPANSNANKGADGSQTDNELGELGIHETLFGSNANSTSASNGSAEKGSRPERRGRTKPRAKPQVSINVLVDHQVLAGDGPGRCEIPGFGPVSADTVREWADDCYLNVLLRKGKDVTTVASERRYIPADIKRALAVQLPICSIRGCERTVGLELDHNQELQHGGLTELSNLGFLCRHHHMLKTHKGFKLRGKPGDYTLVPPDSPADLLANSPPG